MVGDELTLIIINGSHRVKTGFSGDNSPRSVYPSVVGHRKGRSSSNSSDCYVGDEAFAVCGILVFHNVFKEGLINNFDHAEKLWHHNLYNELRVAPEDHPLICSERVNTPDQDRKKMCEIMFEKFQIPAYYVLPDPFYSLYASGRTSGAVLDIGHEVSSVTPIYEGSTFSHSVIHHNLAGKKLTNYFIELLSKKGYTRTTSAEREIARDMKEKHGYITNYWDQEEKSFSNPCDYELPDGTVISLKNERYRFVEALFHPKLISNEERYSGIHNMLYTSIGKMDLEIRGKCYENIILAGGSTLFEGFQERLTREMTSLIPQENVKIVSPLEKINSSWIGASMIGALSTKNEMYMTKQLYEEYGVGCLYWICPSSSIYRHSRKISYTKNNIQRRGTIYDITFQFK
jgi:actin